LNRADVWLLTDHQAPAHWVLGNTVPRAERPLGGRTHALQLDLPPGSRAELWLRVETAGAMILPITLNTPAAFLARSVDEQMLQGLLTGLGLFLVLYSLSQWTGLREPMFWRYALLTGSSVMFSVAQFGLGAQYLWGDNAWFERHMPGLTALLAATGTALFVQAVLAGDRPRSAFSRLMYGCAALLLVTAAAYALDWIDVQVVSAVVGTLGLAPALLGLPGAFRRWRQGDAVGGYLIVAWLGYFVATGLMVGLIGGRQPATWWMLHVFQIGATLDMLLFLRVLALRMAAVHTRALTAAREHETLHSLAHTDALTGLPNRRGLAAELEARLATARGDRLLALVVLDLDGFKQINDEYGHAVGDALLVAVARRLRERVREHDLIARLGGDEFVVMVDGLRNVAQAETLGRHLLAAFEAPFDAAGHTCPVGLTAGYVLAPLDGRDARALLIAADTAMLAGKRAGKRQIRRADLQPVS
jgi:diguanylate cyclase